jgi:hypothetical protein
MNISRADEPPVQLAKAPIPKNDLTSLTSETVSLSFPIGAAYGENGEVRKAEIEL